MKSEYLVTGLIPVNTRKTVVCINYEKSFALYKKELGRFSISENSIVPEDTMNYIYNNVLYPRARERALNILESSSRTSMEIRRKLKDGYYPKIICDRVISMLEEYGYLNDYEYARYYFTGRIKSKSCIVIRNELRNKGVSEDIINIVAAETDYDESSAIEAYIRKKGIIPNEMDYREKSKLCASLLRKGYNFDDIQKTVERMR